MDRSQDPCPENSERLSSATESNREEEKCSPGRSVLEGKQARKGSFGTLLRSVSETLGKKQHGPASPKSCSPASARHGAAEESSEVTVFLKLKQEEDVSQGGGKIRKRDSLVVQARKNVSSKAATSPVGKAVLRKLLDPETAELVRTAKKVFAILFGKKEQVLMFDKIVKLFVKINLQLELKHITMADFRPLNSPLRSAFNELVQIHKKFADMDEDTKKAHFAQAAAHLQAVGNLGLQPMMPYLSPKNQEKFNGAINKFASPDWMRRAFDEPLCKEYLDSMCRVMNRLMFRL